MASTSEGDRHMNPPPDGGGGGGSGGGEQKTKRKMKTAAQLELLEKTYAVETYPSESLRAELSAELGLTDRQLQMWFCHRRLKDRKVQPPKRQKKDTGGSTTVVNVPVTGVGLDDVMMGERVNEPGSGSGSGSSQYESRKVTVRTPHMPSVSRISVEGPPPMVKRYYESPQVISEMRAVAFVEAQLGEPVREDGPVLGMDFDPLPPGAFGAPIDTPVQQKQVGRSYDGKMYEHHEPKSIKTPPMIPNVDFVPGPSGGKRKHSAGSGHLVHPKPAARGLHEYQFLPEQPSGRPETYERVDPPRLYSPAIDAPSGRVSSLSTGPSYVHAKEQVTPSYAPQGQVQSVSHLSQQGRQGHVYSSASGEYDNVPPNNSFVNIGVDSQIGAHPAVGLENPFLSPDRRASQEEDASRIERKRKSEEARIAKEVEAHEKRIRKELEKQDILRRKREEQMRREMEKHDRERRKEEERLMREKQREEERFQREQRREHERRERFLQKETLRAEKMRQKEELRREKEAARLKAANERATARRIAKESMELIEDERLELMDLAVAKKGLPSILSLDSDTLQNLELFRDMLSTFPPKSVHLKRPFAIQPWSNSEENVGNLLMVWRFLITFADVLELWPFTLDEFVQGLHDYDPRLLGEIHVALLRSIIKDIEDVARTPSIGLGVNQNSAANPGGGHPQIVEGAYSWGFDIRSWQRHLNPLTWPEILRQFALSAGFGPQLKKRSVERAYFRDDNEGHDGEDIISTLRNGVAAENAVAVMQEKGFSQSRRSRHRLTPGTVKFAAFHVLSLEGSKGLTILEVADKIQKSGLRDLTTSKTPEASIAAALSRDGSLFERTAPSTYCVRAAFRKDPADAEAILSAARAKVQVFQNGYSDSEAEKDADAEDADDVEKDDDSEGDVAEDQELDDVNSNKGTCLPNETKATKSIEWAGNGRIDTLFDESPQNGLVNVGKGFSSYLSEGSKEVNPLGVTVEQSNDVDKCNASSNLEMEDTEIDESNSGEPWVQGLTEGEYCDLSVEERLNALVALIGVAIEGNSIRVILEERLEAANALKKQMWAEAQLDKRRMKEEYATKLHYSSYTGTKSDPNFPSSAVDGNQSPFILDSKNNDSLSNSAIKQESTLDPLSGQHLLNTLPTERNLAAQESTVGPDYLSQPLAAEKSRSQLKSYIGFKAEEMYVYRSLPLGQDRRRNKYWQFVTSASRNDPGSGRIFFESQSGCWRLIDTEEAFDALVASLDTRGMRESHLHLMLHKIEMAFRESVRRSSLGAGATSPSGSTIGRESSQIKSSPDCSAVFDSPVSASCAVSSDAQDRSPSFRIELDRTQTEKNNALKRYQDFQNWMWKECLDPSLLCGLKVGKKRCNVLLLTCDLCHDTYFSEDNHCPICHRPFGSYSNSSFSDHVNQCKEKQKVDFNWKFHGSNSFLPLRTRVLKSQLALVEVSIPPEALQPLWTDDYRKSWGMRLQSSLSSEELLQFLTCLESSIKRDCISSSFETTKELLGNKKPGCAVEDSSFDIRGPVPILPWVPQTTAAVALRLMELDASISYMLHEKVESYKDNEAAEFIKLPSRYTVVAKVEEMEQLEALDQANYLQVENWIDPPSGRSYSSRGRGGRGRGRGRSRGGRLPRGGSGSRSQLGKVNAGSFERIAQVPGRKSRTRGRGGRRRGRRTARSRPEPNKRVVEKDTNLGHFGLRFVPEQNSGPESPRSSGGMDWERAAGRMHVEEVDNRYREEASESDDNGQATGYGYERRTAAYPGMFNGRPEDLTEESDDDGDGDEDSDDEEPVGEDEGDAYEEDEGYMDGNLDGLGNGDEDEEADEDDDGEEEDATSSDYSD